MMIDQSKWPSVAITVAYANYLAHAHQLIRWENPTFVLFRASVLLALWALLIRQLVRVLINVMDPDTLTAALADVRQHRASKLLVCIALYVAQQSTFLWILPLVSVQSRYLFSTIYLLATIAICWVAACSISRNTRSLFLVAMYILLGNFVSFSLILTSFTCLAFHTTKLLDVYAQVAAP
jgi:hypothetical protein